MADITFSKEEKELIVNKIKIYFSEKLNHEIGQFDALFLLDFFTDEIGAYIYNRGLYDAQAILQNRLENISEAIYDLEKITEFRR